MSELIYSMHSMEKDTEKRFQSFIKIQTHRLVQQCERFLVSAHHLSKEPNCEKTEKFEGTYNFISFADMLGR